MDRSYLSVQHSLDDAESEQLYQQKRRASRKARNTSFEIDGSVQTPTILTRKFRSASRDFNRGLSYRSPRPMRSSIKRRPDPGSQAYEELFKAVQQGHLMKVKALLRKYVGFELNHRNTEGLTLLHKAIQWGHLDVTSFLLRKGTNVNVPDVSE